MSIEVCRDLIIKGACHCALRELQMSVTFSVCLLYLRKDFQDMLLRQVISFVAFWKMDTMFFFVIIKLKQNIR